VPFCLLRLSSICVVLQPWLCLTLRFPALAGLKLPEDEIVVVRCRPQDRTVQENKEVDLSGAESVATLIVF
jgi:hypothetical protein